MGTKIQNLLLNWPPHAIRLVSALKREGYSQSLIARYKNSGWLTAIGEGALIKKGDTPTLAGAVAALQNDLNLDVHFGALTALEFQGYAHFIRVESSKAWIFGTAKKLPKWFTNYDWGRPVEYHSSHLFSKIDPGTLTQSKEGEIRFLIANEIRAMFEMLSLVPKKFNIEESMYIMQGFTVNHHKGINELLRACNSIKVKRLFLLLAEICDHSWVKRINIKKLELGVGPRNLFPGGRMDKKYLITVPAEIYGHEGNEGVSPF